MTTKQNRGTERLHDVQISKEMLGINTRKRILYLDQNFWSMAFRKTSKADTAMQRIEGLLDLQLLAVPYSSIHEKEARFWIQHGQDLLRFVQSASRGHRFEPYYRIERTQILKAFQRFLESTPASYVREERDALSLSIHDWDGPFSVSIYQAVSGTEVSRRRGFKKEAVDELVGTLRDWRTSKNTFEQDMQLELRDSARMLAEKYGRKSSRIWAGDFSALLDSPVDADIVEDMLWILRLRGARRSAIIAEFFKSEHFALAPSQQLSARLFSAFKKQVREGLHSNSRKARERLSGFLIDVQHAATYVPYCHAFFTDRFMANLLNDTNVRVEEKFGCKVFSVAKWQDFFDWLDNIESSMTAEHADGLRWAYPKYRRKA